MFTHANTEIYVYVTLSYTPSMSTDLVAGNASSGFFIKPGAITDT